MIHHHQGKSHPAAAVAGKTARACDSCIRHRARWFCAADDAFLCHPCDSLIHSANPLSRRHHRLRIQSSSSSSTTIKIAPVWHHGFKRKARTPRSHKSVVPELESSVEEEEEEQLLYRVPVFDPALAFGTQLPPHPSPASTTGVVAEGAEAEFESTEIELAEFTANMESLLDRGEAYCMEELGLGEGGVEVEVKGENEEERKGGSLSFNVEVDLSRETLELDFGSESSEIKEEKEESRGMGLRLDYEAVKDAWVLIGSSPWMNGERPRVGVEDYWLECLGMWGGLGGESVGGGIQVMDVGREARVTRYREKRRTRLFSKKIRYEVRKLNAEKRPRMKGRFVKRASVSTNSTAVAGGVTTTGGGPVAFAY